MGGNNSYNKTLDRVKGNLRTHREFHYRIEGHKILLQNKNPKQIKMPMNSNSESPIYLIGRKRKDGSIEIASIGIYKNHKCIGQIDLKFDSKGNLIPYSNNGEASSHYHKFSENESSNKVGRRSRDKHNHLPIESKYDLLLKKIEEFNKGHIS